MCIEQGSCDVDFGIVFVFEDFCDGQCEQFVLFVECFGYEFMV